MFIVFGSNTCVYCKNRVQYLNDIKFYKKYDFDYKYINIRGKILKISKFKTL